MDTAIITWLSVLTLAFIVFVSKMFVSMKHRAHMVPVRVRSHHHRHHVFELSNEREMLFIPGDSVRTNGYDNDCNADDNY
ncbi:MAG: hypothetical protein K2K00_05800 [Muribaculaceae bacterium]|nr:hypothetical protein [Muribaculaceae bacterium]MDE6703172.1 hypothetical protein [Muribaculaceae bacterium]